MGKSVTGQGRRRHPSRRREDGPTWALPLITGVIVAIVGAYTVTQSIAVTIIAAILAVAFTAWIAALNR